MAIQAQLYSDNSFGDFVMNDDTTDNDAAAAANLCFLPNHFDDAHTTNLINQYDHHHHHLYQQQSTLDFSQSVSAHIENQRFEFQHLLNLQNERLSYAIQEQNKHHISAFLRRYESKARLLVAQKDQEIATAATRTADLQEFLRNLEIEGLTWQRIARENESMAASLTATINRLQRDHDDAESCCPAPQVVDDPARCRRCQTREARVILLPCRHLCSCGECEVYLDTCPVCMAGKRGSIAVEAFA